MGEAGREGEGQGRRRRRRGGRGGERGNRPERGPRDDFATEGAPADAIESRPAELESERAPRHESMDDSSHRDSPADHEAVEERFDPQIHEHEPVEPAFSQASSHGTLAAPAAFRAVSEHDEVADESGHHPKRKRRHAEGQAEEAQLQLVETQAEAPVVPAEDELPHRTKPRRRRSQAADNEPLKLVETQPGTQPSQDGVPTQ
jgi:ribonuclease E